MTQSIGEPPQPAPASGGPAQPPPLPVSPRATAGADPQRRPGLTPITLLLTLLIAYVLLKVQIVLVLVLLSVLLATIVERPVHLLERRHVPRGLGILAVYVGLIASLVLFFVLLAPAIGDQADRFRTDAPEQLQQLRDDWRDSANPILSGPGRDLLAQGIRIIERPGDEVSVPQEAAVGVATNVGGAVVGLVTVLIIAFYYLMEKTLLRQLVLVEVAPEARQRVSRIWDNVEAKVGQWLRGQLLLCLTVGLLATVGYGILGVEFWPVLGLWAGITEIVPIVGPWIGGVPAVVIALTQGWNTALLVVGFIVLIQMLENAVLVPRIMRGAVGLTPLTVFLAILTGTQFLGVAGAVLAIPLAAAVQVVLTDYFGARREAQRGAGTSLPAWRWMRGPLAAAPLHPTPVDPAEPDPRPPSERPTSSAPGPAPGWTGDVIARATRRTED